MKKLYEWIDGVWQWIAETIFLRFEFDLPVESLKQFAEGGKVIFALSHGGMLEWLILSSWCRNQGFGAILVANRKRILLLAKPKYFFEILFRRRTYADLFLSEQDGPRLVFCPPSERKKAFVPTPGEQLFSDVYSTASARGIVSHITFFPVFILWRKHLRGGRNLSEYLFGLSSKPNLIGKIWYLWRRRKDSTVRALKPFTMGSKETEAHALAHDVLEESESMRVAKSTRRKILIEQNQEMRVVLGPRYNSQYAVKETLIRDPDIQALIGEIAQKEGVDRRRVMSRAYQNLTEIVANYRFRFVEVLYVFDLAFHPRL